MFSASMLGSSGTVVLGLFGLALRVQAMGLQGSSMFVHAFGMGDGY